MTGGQTSFVRPPISGRIFAVQGRTSSGDWYLRMAACMSGFWPKFDVNQLDSFGGISSCCKALGFKARVGISLECFVTCSRWISNFYLIVKTAVLTSKFK